MAMVRIIAILVAIAFVLAITGIFTRKPGYLTWAWRTFVFALVCALGLMLFYFVERALLGP